MAVRVILIINVLGRYYVEVRWDQVPQIRDAWCAQLSEGTPLSELDEWRYDDHRKEAHGCCDRIEDQAEALVGGYEEFITSRFIYVTPRAKPRLKYMHSKVLRWSTSPIGMTRIIPTYGSNRVEIDKIVNNIKSVSDDKMPYKQHHHHWLCLPMALMTNERLARGVQSQKLCVGSLIYSKLISTSYVAEDWEGFRQK